VMLLLTGLWVHDSHTQSMINQSVSQNLEGVNRLERSLAQHLKQTEVTTGIDVGAALAQAVVQALPMPSGGVPGQMAAPCRPSAEEIDDIGGYCWLKTPLTEPGVKLGACEDQGFYEPSVGWCRAHKLGYRPFYQRRRNNHVVKPE